MAGLGYSALIAGDGMAGALASAVLKRAGWRVVMAGRPTAARPHFDHVHTVTEDTLRLMEGLCGQALNGWCLAPAFLAVAGDCSPAPSRPVVCARHLRDSLLTVAQPNLRIDDGDLDALDASGHAWFLNGERFDLLIDATGPAPALKARLASLSDIDLEWLESDVVEVCATFTGQAFDLAAPAAMTIVLPDLLPQVDGLLVLGGNATAQLTLRGARASSVSSAQVADALAWAGGEAISGLVDRLSFTTAARLFRSPVSRRANDDDVSPCLPPVLSLGDALVQTAPSLGQGLRCLVHQVQALSLITGPGDVKTLRQSQIGQAQGLWLMSQMQAGMAVLGVPA